jgi:adenine-specific DNA-methyltransferase
MTTVRLRVSQPAVMQVEHTTRGTTRPGSLRRVDSKSYGEKLSRNRVIHGENLSILTHMADTESETIKCAYLDPPYNNGESYRHYHDSMTHEEWLGAITKRIVCVRELLRCDGSLWISIDDSELHYLKVAADEVMGRKNFVGTIVWERRSSRENRKVLSRNHEYILVYAKDIQLWAKARNSLPLTADVEKRYKNPDHDPRGPWQSVSANVQDGHATARQQYVLKAPNGRSHLPPKGRCWIYDKLKMKREVAANNVWFGVDGNAVPRLKCFLSDRKNGLTPHTLWRSEEVGSTTEAKRELIKLFKEDVLFDTPKPERLMHRILQISTNPGDAILDAYMGSGTTLAVAHKMGRVYTGIEIGDHIKTHCLIRMKQVVNGEQGGISTAVQWRGGGGFGFFTV